MEQSIQARLYARLEKAPERRAIAFYNGRGEVSWKSFWQFHNQAVGYAARLREQGLRNGDVCILVLPSNELCATLIFSILILGAIPLLVAPPTIQGERAYSSLAQILKGIIGKTKPRLVVCAKSLKSMQEDLEDGRRRTRFLYGEDELSPTNAVMIQAVTPGNNDIAGMQLTSGTTGFPRVCVWEQKSVLAALDGMAVAMKLNEEDVCLNWTPLYHDMGLVNNFLLCLTYGIPLVLLNPLNFVNRPAIWLRALFETGATVTWSPNFGFAITAQRVRDDQIEGIRLDGVRAFWNAAERIHLETMLAFHERFAPIGLRYEALKTNFGCAENIGGATFSDPDAPFVFERVDRSILQSKRIAKPVDELGDAGQAVTIVGAGQPHPEIRIKILSRSGRPLADGHIGEVALETPSSMAGYLGDLNGTRRALYGKLLRTGDLGYLRGKELFWVGRVKERLTVRGKKLDPSDFEPVLLKIPDLRQGCFSAFGIDDKTIGTQRVIVITEIRDSTSRSSREITDEIRDQVFVHLGVTLDDVVLVQPGTLAKTSSGKRRHRFFRKLYLEGKLKQVSLPLKTSGVDLLPA